MNISVASLASEQSALDVSVLQKHREALFSLVKKHIETRTEDFAPGPGLCGVKPKAYQDLEKIVQKWFLIRENTTLPNNEEKCSDCLKKIGDELVFVLHNLLWKKP